jgi:hypothetical protein
MQLGYRLQAAEGHLNNRWRVVAVLTRFPTTIVFPPELSNGLKHIFFSFFSFFSFFPPLTKQLKRYHLEAQDVGTDTLM